MDRAEKPRRPPQQPAQRQRGYANEPEVATRDRPLLDTPAGRDDDRGLSDRNTMADEDVRSVPVGATPRSDVTGAPEPGTTSETADGLDETEEAVRLDAEDTPTGDGREDAAAELPVFERALTKPKR
jgi:hypothetical protein